MSGIAKPTLFFSTALPVAARDQTVNVEDIANIDKLDVPAFGVGNPAKAQILVVMKKGTPRERVFSFADASARNTAFAAAKTLISASV
jgi:hypothetical protein